ncbi:glycosyltransferase family 2 protein [Porphyromonas cangingivalis]|uniref:glycosyltransferase family 2 protein n=1 Tax=Porphyromonas cangingivalis TaxID=36874 RepID=UPI002432EDEA|nr:glycosyltransferase family 2 protein [Porphyromonas cangingivalis]
MSPIISVIIPAYNVAKHLNKCLDSVVSQTLRDIEIILIDDGSTDDTPCLCDEWGQKDERIRVIHQANSGIATSRNRGIALSSADIIAFIDSDDWIEPDMYEILYAAWQKYDADLVVCNAVFDYVQTGESSLMHRIGRMHEGLHPKRKTLALLMHEKRFDSYCWNKLYKKSLFDDYPYPDGLWMEDHSTTFKHYYAAERIVYVDKALYHYIRHGENFTMTPGVKMEKAYLLALQERLRFCQEHPFLTPQEFAILRIKSAQRAMVSIEQLMLHTPVEEHRELKAEFETFIEKQLFLLKGSFFWSRYPRLVRYTNKGYAKMRFSNQPLK